MYFYFNNIAYTVMYISACVCVYVGWTSSPKGPTTQHHKKCHYRISRCNKQQQQQQHTTHKPNKKKEVQLHFWEVQSFYFWQNV